MTPRIQIILFTLIVSVAAWCAASFVSPGALASDPGQTLAPATPQTEKLSGTYRWNTPEDEKRYAKASWHTITTTRMQGFLPTVLIEKKSEGCPDANMQPALRRFGAFCPYLYWLEEKDRPNRNITSIEQLKARFTPITSEARAVAFVGVTQSDLKISRADILEGHVLTIDGGYLVQAVVGNSLGCSQHEPFGAIFKVLKNGEISKIAIEPEPKSLKPVICVD